MDKNCKSTKITPSENMITNYGFIILLFFFSFSYFSYFPGAYSFDSAFLYMSSLGYEPYIVGGSPLFTIFWKIFNNYSFGPFISLYLLIICFVCLSFYHNFKFTSILFLLVLLLPATMQTIVFAWKDNALAITLSLIILIYSSKSGFSLSKRIKAILFILFLFAFAMRLNAIFALIPILFLLLEKYLFLSRLRLGLILLVSIFGINYFITSTIYNAGSAGYVTAPLTDIAKMNFYSKRPVEEGIPQSFLVRDALSKDNVNKMFNYYNSFSCNDILVMYKKWNDADAFLSMRSVNINDHDKVQRYWVSYIVSHPMLYAEIRFMQWYNAVTSLNIPRPDFSLDPVPDMKNIISSMGAIKTLDNYIITSKIFLPINGLVIIRDGYTKLIGNGFIRFLSYPLLFILLEIFLLIWVMYLRDTNLRPVKLTLLSGILYAIGYLPILPCTDYRYFLWTIISCFISIGMLIDFRMKAN